MDTYAYRRWKRVLAALLVGALMLSLTACDSPASPTPAGGRLRVVATTTIVGDVVRQVGGEHIELTVLLAPGIDPHAFQPTPQDVAMVSQAQVVFVNGVGLEEFLDELLQHAGGSRPVISVSEGIAPRALTGDATDEHGNLDPHVWFSPANVSIWARNIARVLSTLDPAHQEAYAANAAAYETSLDELDTWIKAQVDQVPAERRKLVTDHMALGYFADRYGFQLVGTVVKGFSSAAEPSAQEVALLEQEIRQYQVPAIFVGQSVNAKLSQRIAEDTGIRLVPLYTGSLSAPGGEADTYDKLMRYDVTAIVGALQ
ncbi:MAG: zinc ABC transporter substrate-binding protein [Chloroflexi bacterium]|nr:zinc ABC transporter substrate-binding protein [Chloroflexota bacterium]MBU1751829.1 zinc ABC transporter substrate-binding protein [Chloroflexota bacterium]